MTRNELYSELRDLIGNPDPNDVTNKMLESAIVPALERLAVELNYNVQTDVQFPLIAETREYQLSDNFSYIVYIEWNDVRLVPSSIYQWEIEGSRYPSVTSSNPREYAVFGRRLILNPPASAGAVSTDGFLAVQYIASSPVIDGGGVPGLGNLDMQLVLYYAAIRFLRARPSEENLARISGYMEETAVLLPAARKRAQNMLESYSPHFNPTIDRYRGAR